VKCVFLSLVEEERPREQLLAYLKAFEAIPTTLVRSRPTERPPGARRVCD